MQESTNKEKVLKKVRKAIMHKTPNPYPNLDHETNVYARSTEPGEVAFAEAFTDHGGNFVFCENDLDFAENLINLALARKWTKMVCIEPSLQKTLDECEFPYQNNLVGIENAEVAITGCEYLISRTGSIMVSSLQAGSRKILSSCPVHIVVARSSQLVQDMKDALQQIRNKYPVMPSMITTITGPSRTADIEKKVVIGAHGTHELYLFLLDEPGQ